jgi:hypothetical protein
MVKLMPAAAHDGSGVGTWKVSPTTSVQFCSLTTALERRDDRGIWIPNHNDNNNNRANNQIQKHGFLWIGSGSKQQ